MLLLTTNCGGGGDVNLYPLWVATDVIVADIDGDGRADVLTLAMLAESASQRSGRLTVYRQTAAGRFAEPDLYVVGVYPWTLTLGDIDGDGAPDLVVADVDGRVVWLLWQDAGNRGRFLAPQVLAQNVRSSQAAIADLNGDGAPDIAYAADRIVVHHQRLSQRRSFLPPVDLVVPGKANSVVAGDLDGDSRADLLLWTYLDQASPGNSTLALSLQQPGGSLGAATTLAPQTGLLAGSLAIADFDGDGRNDLFSFFTPQSTDYRGKLTVLLQQATPGSFGPPLDTSLAGVQGIEGAVVADLNHDGRPDVAVVGFFPVGSPTVVHSRLNLFVNPGGGSLALAAVHELPISASRVGAGDIDGDGLVDLVIFAGETPPLWMRQSATAPGSFAAPAPLP